MKQLISIITPMYNLADLIGETIDTVIQQTYPHWEMIIVDDQSPDNGAGIAVVEQYSQQDSRIKLIKAKVNKGSSGARNTAIKAAQGKIIAFLDGDDLWDQDYLQQQLDFMAKKKATIVFSSYRRIDEETKTEILKPFIVPKKVNYKSILKSLPIFPSAAMIDISVIGKIYFNEAQGSLRDDYVMWLAVLREKVEFAYGNPSVLVSYRLRKSSVTSQKNRVILPHWNVLYRVEKLPFIKAAYYLGCWAWISFWKYKN